MSGRAPGRAKVAPTFHRARVTLHERLDGLVCGVLARQVRVPEDSREIDADGTETITYYHGLAQKTEPQLRHTTKRKRRSMIWLNKSTRAKRPLQISSALFTNSTDHIPVPGEMVVGEVQHREDNKASFRYWHGQARCVWELKKLVQHGTNDWKRLRQKLCTEDHYDDLFVIGAVVLFGDVQLVVDEILNTEDRRYQLRLRSEEPLVCFLHRLSVDLKDPKIWDRTVELLPDAEERLAACMPDEEIDDGGLAVVPLTESMNQNGCGSVSLSGGNTSHWGSLLLQQQHKPPPPRNTSGGFLWPSGGGSIHHNPSTAFAKGDSPPMSPTYGPPSPTSPPMSPTYGPPSPTITTSTTNSTWCVAAPQNLDFLNEVPSTKPGDTEDEDIYGDL